MFRGKLISLVVKKVRLPNGYVATLETIKHPGAALIIPFLSRNKIIMLKQYRPIINSYIYELPAGTLDRNERPAECARREITEETGFSSGRVTRLGKIFPVPGYSTECIHIYKAERLRRVAHKREADEVIESRAYSRAEVRRLFRSGAIVDAKTIAAFAMCGWL